MAKLALTAYGVQVTREKFTTMLFEELERLYPHRSIDELVLHPTEASRFCQEIRATNGWSTLPDDVILRTLMNKRKAARR